MNTAAHAVPYAVPYRGARRRPARPFPWVPAFIVFQLACQLMLISGLAGVRVLVRMGAFGASLGLLALLRGRGSAHPARGPAIFVFAILGVCIFHPETSSSAAGIAQVGLYAAVLAPLFWVPRLTSIDIRTLRHAVMVLWAFHTFSAAIGVVQVYRPGTLQPPISTVVQSKGKGYVESLKIT
ncbi:MAG: hypothetical protein KY444_06980, partial [Gemmatimonadetes bacterium]|nr:hypothetical protein [Gemmatimonadota bacterium]